MESPSLPEDVIGDLKKLFDGFKAHSTTSDKQDTEGQLQDSVCKLDEILANIKDQSLDFLKVLAIKASLYYERAKIHLNCNDMDKSKTYLENGLEMIKEIGELERARTLLEKLVNEELKCEPKIYSTEDLLSNQIVDQSTAKSKINKLMINNMQMLGWIYGKLGLTDQYAVIVHKTLQKELDINDGDPIQWAIRCFRLASLFLARGNWENARYHLTAAQAVLDPLEVNVTPNNLLFKAQADLARVWVNYGLQLFSSSKKSVLERIWDEAGENKIREKTSVEEDMELLTFIGIEVKVPSVPVKEITQLSDAKEVFLHTHKWLKRARFFYTLRDYPIQYVNIILELSELYRFLSFYENNIDDQYQVQKKRYDTLETLSAILKEIRPQCYAAVSVEIIREIMEVQIELMNLNLKRIYNPNEDAKLGEEDLKKRIDAITDINLKIEDLCKEDKIAIEEVELVQKVIDEEGEEFEEDSVGKTTNKNKDKIQNSKMSKGEGEKAE